MRALRKILLPFSWIYGGIILLRNFFYDQGWFSSTSFDLPVICIGNLRVGGTGKTPMTEYIVRILKDEYRLALLSRGYKRRSRGFVLAGPETTVADLGDEPFQFYRKFPEVAVAVDTNRVAGIRQLEELIAPDIVLLDDAFQHRKVKAGLYILLTVYNDLYTSDTVLPAGNLRDTRNQAERADIIVVTKCPSDLGSEEMNQIREALKPLPEQVLCFATIDYDAYLYDKSGNRMPLGNLPENATLVTGIASPAPLLRHLEGQGLSYVHKEYPDHHHFSRKEIDELKKASFLFTTEKDFVRLDPELDQVYYLPIKVRLIEGQQAFEDRLRSVIL